MDMQILGNKNKTMGLGFDLHDVERHLSTHQGLSQGTIVTRRSRIRIFVQWLQDNGLSLNSESTISFFYFLEYERKLSGTSINTYHTALWSFQKYVQHRYQGFESFMSGIGRKDEEEPDIRPLTVSEIRLIVAECLKEAKGLERTRQDITLFLIYTGSRYEDAESLVCRSIDIKGKEVIYRQLKTKKMRSVFIEEPLLSRLKKRVEGKMDHSLVFENSVGGVMHQPDYHQWLQKIKGQTSINKRVSPHIFRHSYGQNHYDMFRDIYLTRDTIGHRKVESTMRYAKNSRERLRESQSSHPHIEVPKETAIRFLEKDIERNAQTHLGSRLDYWKFRQALQTFMIAVNESMSS